MTRAIKETILRVADMAGALRIARHAVRRKLLILCYHGIWLGPGRPPGSFLFMSPARFRRRLKIIRAGGFPVLDLDEALSRLDAGSLPDNAVVITIDDGWYGTYKHMVPALAASGLPSTIYAYTDPMVRHFPVFPVVLGYMLSTGRLAPVRLSSLVGEADGDPTYDLADAQARVRFHTDFAAALFARVDGEDWRAPLERLGRVLDVDIMPLINARVFDLMTPEELEDASQQGMRVELHTHDHGFPVNDLVALRSTIDDNRRHLERIVGGDFRHFCYPSGRYAQARFRDLEALGIASATTCEPGFVDRNTERLRLPRILDGESVSESAFRAELCGLIEQKRRVLGWRRGSAGGSLDD